jgi:hypothetical protein
VDWIWLIFLLFSAVAGLLEKLAKQKMEKPARPAPRSPRPPGEGRFFLDELEKKINQGRPWPAREGTAPGERPGPGPRLEERPALGERRGPVSLEDEYLMPSLWEEETTTGQEEEWAGDGGAVWETKGDGGRVIRDKSSPVEQSWEEPLPGQEWIKPGTFLPALVLAQVLQRPDFRVLPWQRRL